SDLAQRDDRSAQFFAGTQEKGTIEDFAYARKSKQYALNQAPPAQLPAPQMSVLEDKSQDGVRTLKLRLFSPRQAGMVAFYLDSNPKFLNAPVDAVQATNNSQDGSPWEIQTNAFPKKGVNLNLKLKTPDRLNSGWSINRMDCRRLRPQLSLKQSIFP